MNQQRDLARESFDALIGAVGITAEARELSGDQSLTDEQALNLILDRRFGHLPERQAHIACAARYDVELPA